MQDFLGKDRKSPSPAIIAFAIAAFVCALLLSALYSITIYREVATQQLFLSERGEPNSYLVPVDCGNAPRGVLGRDYLRGSARLRGHRHQSKEVCWYSPSTYDRLFEGRFLEAGLAAHVAQASETEVDLLFPAFSNTLFIGFGFLAVSALSIAIMLHHKRKN